MSSLHLNGARRRQRFLPASLFVVLLSASSVNSSHHPQSVMDEKLPTAARMDPLLIRKLYESESRVAPVTKAECTILRERKFNAKGTGLHPNDIEFLNHLSVAAPSTPPQSKIMCIAYTYVKDHEKKANGMVSTWMHRCDGAVMLSNVGSATVPSVEVPKFGEESYSNIWQKSRANWKYVYDNYFDEYDWFVFGGTDYYVLVENMRLYLESDEIQSQNAKGTPFYMGRRFTTRGDPNVGEGQFNSGGPSYVLNKAALKLFIDNLENKESCSPNLHTAGEDVLIANCLRKVANVLPYDTRDTKHRERFHPFTPGSHMFFKIVDQAAVKAAGKALDWYTRYSAWGIQTGLDCCNPYSIAWHYIQPNMLRAMDSLFYACRTPEMLAQFAGSDPLPFMVAAADAAFEAKAMNRGTIRPVGQSKEELRKKFDAKLKTLQDKHAAKRRNDNN